MTGKTLDRKVGPRRALMTGLAVSFITHGHMKTTKAKAKAVQPFIERCVTLARKGTLAQRRLLLSRLRGNRGAVKQLFDVVAPRFASRPGGYTRILPLMRRKGDGAQMAMLEWTEAATTTPAAPAPAAAGSGAKK